MTPVAPDVYISADVEADGPIPGEFSMLAFGLVVAGSFDGRAYEESPEPRPTFYRELRPISGNFDADALAVSGLDRNELEQSGTNPEVAMREATEWVLSQSSGGRPVLVGYPVVFDWLFLHWYFVRFAGESPFGFSGALDMKTMYQQKARVVLGAAGRRDLPRGLRSPRPHTHHALDDAAEQADIFNRLYNWEGPT